MKRAIFCDVKTSDDDKTKPVYCLSYSQGEFNLVEENATKFVAKFLRYYGLEMTLFDAWQYFRVSSSDQDLHSIFSTLESTFNDSILDILLETNDVWDIHHDFNFDTKQYVFECKSNSTLEEILENPSVSSKAKCILKSDFARLKHQIRSEEDIIQLESTPNDICSGVAIRSANTSHIKGTICLFMNKTSNDQLQHYCLTARHVMNTVDDLNNNYKISHKFGRSSEVSFFDENPIELHEDAIALRVNGSFNCRFLNLNCIALNKDASLEVLSPHNTETNSQRLNTPPDDVLNDLFENSRYITTNLQHHANPCHVKEQDIRVLKKKYTNKNKKLPIYKYGAISGLTVGFVKKIGYTTQIENTNYKNLIEVKSLDEINFATSGDSGSLYYIYSDTQEFVPIAMHVGSCTSTRLSYGILLHKIFDAFHKKGEQFVLCSSLTCL
jgi:hypothetical protein